MDRGKPSGAFVFERGVIYRPAKERAAQAWGHKDSPKHNTYIPVKEGIMNETSVTQKTESKQEAKKITIERVKRVQDNMYDFANGGYV